MNFKLTSSLNYGEVTSSQLLLSLELTEIVLDVYTD